MTANNGNFDNASDDIRFQASRPKPDFADYSGDLLSFAKDVAEWNLENRKRSNNFAENNSVNNNNNKENKNLSSLEGLEIIDTPRYDFRNIAEARSWAKENITGTYRNVNTGEDISVSGKAIYKYLSEKAASKSVNLDAHLSALKQLPKLIETSILREVKQDRDITLKLKKYNVYTAL